MSKESIELWLCEDCMVLVETGDASSFDYHYNSDQRDDDDKTEADLRLEDCERGLGKLYKQGDLMNDDTDEAQMRCDDCGHTISASDAVYVKDEWDDDVPQCPACQGLEMRVREPGHDEFSRAGCDCCSSDLAGSLYRYALFPKVTA